MVAGRRSFAVGTIATFLFGGLLTLGVMCSSAQEYEGYKAGAAAVTSAPQSPQDDVSQRDEEPEAEHKARAIADLRRLDGLEESVGGPSGRLAGLFEYFEHRDCAGGVCQHAQRLAQDYVRSRAELIRRMLEEFLGSDGADDVVTERQELASLHATFTAEMAAMAEHVPMLTSLPDILASTLRVPDYLEAPRDDTNQ
jgi:hypothetical protein